ncbi:MAG: hypothetical protein ACREB3_04030, partial [Burkholderiales bacterium]
MAKAPGPTPPGLVGDFAQYLRDLAIQAGKPDYAQMRKATSYGRSALSAAFAGKKLPAWELTAKLVHFLGGDVDAARGRWAAAKSTQIQLRSVGEPASRPVAGQQPDPVELPVPRQLPMDVPHFTARGDELGTLDAFLTQAGNGMPSTVVISAIGGTAGVGKTALAVHWAHRVRERFPDGQLHINLRGYDPGPAVRPEEALNRFLRALNVTPAQIPAELEAQAALYRSLLVGRRMLIVLDNAAT